MKNKLPVITYYTLFFFTLNIALALTIPKAFSNSLCESMFSKIFKAMGLPQKKNTLPPPPPTSLLNDFNTQSTQGKQVRFSFSTYHFTKLEYGDGRFLREEYLYEDFFEEKNHSMRNIGDSYYWSRYLPKKKKIVPDHLGHMGQFVIGFAVKLEGSYPDRPGYFYHRIHWDSNARDKKMNPEAVREIFEKIYNDSPEKIATEFQIKFIEGGDMARAEVDRLIVPFLQDKAKAEHAKRVILRVLQRRGSNF